MPVSIGATRGNAEALGVRIHRGAHEIGGNCVELLRERAGQLVLFGAYQSEIPRLVREGLLTGGAVIWSMWDGYLDQPSGQQLRTVLKSADVPLIQHHTSGHATPADLVRLVHALKPDAVVPIHTEAPDAYADTVGDNVQPHSDGEWWLV